MNITVGKQYRERDLPVSTLGATLSLRGVARSFGVHRVLHAIDLDVAAGGVVAIVGRSGCGKSTLLRLIAGLDEPTSGAVTVGGQSGGRHDTVRLMFQEP